MCNCGTGKGCCTPSFIGKILLIVGGLNWGLVGLFGFNLVNTLLGSIPMAERAVYGLVGLSAVLMLRYLKEEAAAQRLENAVKEVLAQGKFVTYDLKANRDDPRSVGTQEMADAIIKKIK